MGHLRHPQGFFSLARHCHDDSPSRLPLDRRTIMTTAALPRASQATGPSSADPQPGSIQQGPALSGGSTRSRSGTHQASAERRESRRDDPGWASRAAGVRRHRRRVPTLLRGERSCRRHPAGIAQLDVDDPDRLRAGADAIQRSSVTHPCPTTFVHDHRGLRATDAPGRCHRIVAVRWSATVEDTAQFSFAGMFESFLNVRGRTT